MDLVCCCAAHERPVGESPDFLCISMLPEGPDSPRGICIEGSLFKSEHPIAIGPHLAYMPHSVNGASLLLARIVICRNRRGKERS